MSTRMQQRRGTAAQWISTNSGNGPILAAGEIGFESDTNKFKIGDGVNHWVDLTYFTDAQGALDAVNALIDGAPAALDTLNELAAALGDDPDFLSGLATSTDLTTAISTHSSTTTSVHGIADTTNLANKTFVNDQIDTHSADTTNVHGIADTADLVTLSVLGTQISDHNLVTLNVHGIADTSALATLTDANTAASGAVSTHNSDTTNVHGIADTSVLETQTGAQDKADAAEAAAAAALLAHEQDTTNIHGITDTSLLVTTTGTETLSNKTLSGPTIEVGSVTVSSTEISYLDGVSSNIQTQLDAKATPSDISSAVSTHSSDTTSVHGITDTSKLVATDAASTTLDGDLIVSGDFTVTGTTTTVNATDLVVSDPLIYIGEGNTGNSVDLGIVSSFDDGTYQHSGIVRDASAGTWKLFKGVTDEPTTTINFAQGSLDDLALNNLTAAGVVFTDGTQTKAGVPSITNIPAAESSSFTLGTNRQDEMIPLSGAVTVTLPSTGYSKGQSIDFYQSSGTGAQFASTNGAVGTPGLKLRTTYSVATAMRLDSGWLVFGDLSA